MTRFRAAVVAAGVVVASLGCGNTPNMPKASPRAMAEGAAKDIKAKDSPPDKSAADSAAKQTRLRPLVTGTEWLPEFRPPSEQEVAAMALGRIGPAAVPSLMQTLRHRDAQVRRQAALVLSRIGPAAKDAVPELTSLLDDPDEEVRKAAARALGQIGPQAAAAVPALMRQLVEPTPSAPRR